MMLCACGSTDLGQPVTITQIAADVIATQTAGVPTATFTLTSTRTPTSTPQPAETPIPLPAPEPDLAAKAMKVNVFPAPFRNYGIEFYIIKGEAVRSLSWGMKDSTGHAP